MFMETLLASWGTLSAPSRADNVALQHLLPFLFIPGIKPHPSQASFLRVAGLTLRWSRELWEPRWGGWRHGWRHVVVSQLTEPQGMQEEPKSLLQAARMEEEKGPLPQSLEQQHQLLLGSKWFLAHRLLLFGQSCRVPERIEAGYGVRGSPAQSCCPAAAVWGCGNAGVPIPSPPTLSAPGEQHSGTDMTLMPLSLLQVPRPRLALERRWPPAAPRRPHRRGPPPGPSCPPASPPSPTW